MSIPLIQVSEATAERRRLYFHAVDATDGLAPETGLTGTGWVSKNGATPAASTNSLVEINATNMPGRYYIELTATEYNTTGFVEFRYKAAACAEVVVRAQIVAWDPWDSTRLGLGALPNAAAEAAGGLYTRGTGAGQINQPANGLVDVNVEQWLDAVVNALVSGRMDASVGAMAGDVITAAAIAAGAIGSSEAPFLDAAISTRATPTQVNTEVLDVMDVDTISEPSQGKPAATPTMKAIIAYIWMMIRNKETQSATEYAIHNDAGTKLADAALSDAAGVVTKAEMETGA